MAELFAGFDESFARIGVRRGKNEDVHGFDILTIVR
jgi:hypothetical protein